MIHKFAANPKKSSSKSERIRGLLGYVSNPDDGAKCIFFALSPAFVCVDVEGAIAEMTANSLGAVRSSDTIHHVVLSWPPDEWPTQAQVVEAVQIYVDHIGFADHLYVFGLHDDTDNAHLHIILDRATPEGKVAKINKGFTQIVGAEVVALIEAAQGWAPEEKAMFSVLEDGSLVRSYRHRELSDLAPAPPQRVVDQTVRVGGQSEIQKVQLEVSDLFTKVQSWPELHAALAEVDLKFELKGRGAIIRIDEEHAVKASSISRFASLRKLEARLGQFADPEATSTLPSPVKNIPNTSSMTANLVKSDELEKAFKIYHEAVGAERYRVTCARYDKKTGKKLVTILDNHVGETIGLSPNELVERLPQIAHMNAKGENLFLTPLSSHCHHFVVNGLTSQSLEEMKAEGFVPAIVLESTRGKLHAVVNVARVAPDEIDRMAANELALEMNKKFGSTQPGVPSAPHPMIGSRHLEHGTDRKAVSKIVRFIEVTGEICVGLGKRLKENYNKLKGGINSFLSRRKPAEPSPEPAMFTPRPFDMLADLYEAHRHDIMQMLRKSESFSRLDAEIANRLAATGLSQAEVAATIEAGILAGCMNDAQHGDLSDYAARAAAHACEVDVMAQCKETSGHCFAHWQTVTDSVIGVRKKAYENIERESDGPDI